MVSISSKLLFFLLLLPVCLFVFLFWFMSFMTEAFFAIWYEWGTSKLIVSCEREGLVCHLWSLLWEFSGWDVSLENPKDTGISSVRPSLLCLSEAPEDFPSSCLECLILATCNLGTSGRSELGEHSTIQFMPLFSEWFTCPEQGLVSDSLETLCFISFSHQISRHLAVV